MLGVRESENYATQSGQALNGQVLSIHSLNKQKLNIYSRRGTVLDTEITTIKGNSQPNRERIIATVFLISESCHKKFPHTRWLKTTEMHSLVVMGARHPKSRCWWSHALSEGAKERLLPCIFLAFSGYQQSLVSLVALSLQTLPLASPGFFPSSLWVFLCLS